MCKLDRKRQVPHLAPGAPASVEPFHPLGLTPSICASNDPSISFFTPSAFIFDAFDYFAILPAPKVSAPTLAPLSSPSPSSADEEKSFSPCSPFSEEMALKMELIVPEQNRRLSLTPCSFLARPSHSSGVSLNKKGKAPSPAQVLGVEEKKERNRQAAEKYRQKGRDTITTLETKCLELTSMNQELVGETQILSARNRTLEDEVAYLRRTLAEKQ